MESTLTCCTVRKERLGTVINNICKHWRKGTIEHMWSNVHTLKESQTCLCMSTYADALKGKRYRVDTRTRRENSRSLSHAHKHTFPHRSGAWLTAFTSNYHSYRPVRPEEIGGGLAWLLH